MYFTHPSKAHHLVLDDYHYGHTMHPRTPYQPPEYYQGQYRSPYSASGYPPIAPAPPGERYPRNRPPSSGSPEFPYPYPDSSFAYDAPRSMTPPPGPSSSYPRPPFIPTPSEYTHHRGPPRPSSTMPHPPSSGSRGGPYTLVPHQPPPHPSRPPGSHHPHSSHHSHPSGGSSSTRPRSFGGPPGPPTGGERFVCDVCGKDFSRAHDRKRHHETQHAVSPITHKCAYCDKDFSRADSLKRHLQNGCDEAPEPRQ